MSEPETAGDVDPRATPGHIAELLGVSEPTIKRLLSNGRIGLDRLEQICEALDIDFFELARSARGNRDARRHLSLAQAPQAVAGHLREFLV